jgi:cell division protein FtsI (penicillin-binding protein 3)
MTAPSPARAAVVFGLIVVAFAALVGRVGYLQSFAAQKNVGRAERQQFQTEPLYARRGSVFDRNGLLMAGTVQSQSLFIDPKFMAEAFAAEGREAFLAMDDAVAALCKLIDREPFEVSQLLGDKADSRFVRIADNLDEGTIREIEKLDLPGVGFTPSNVRYYPMGSIAAHVLGGVGADGNGLEGVELKFNKQLAGRDGTKRTLKDARRRPLFVDADDYIPARHGQHLLLTIDANIQTIAEQELGGACEQFKARSGECVVLDPSTGEVLALANWPTFNPQALGDADPVRRRNNALVSPYEPGSTLKPFLVGPALSAKLTRPGEIFPTGGDRSGTCWSNRPTSACACSGSAWAIAGCSTRSSPSASAAAPASSCRARIRGWSMPCANGTASAPNRSPKATRCASRPCSLPAE